MRPHPLPRHPAGFTLLELMIVVTIVGILAATAMPAFQSYLMRSRANDGRMMLEIIKLRQEAYRSEFGHYVQAAAHPAGVNGLTYMNWAGPADWTALGFSPPSNRTRFSLATFAGPPQAGSPGFGLSGRDFWYRATATGDFDADGVLLTFMSFSESDFIWCSQNKGWE